MTTIDLIQVVDPQAVECARRLEFAIRQVSAGMSRCDIVTLLRAQFALSRRAAYMVVEMAIDLAGPTK